MILIASHPPRLPKEKSVSMSWMIDVAHVTYTYPNTERPALESISFQVPPGQFVALLGPTSAGKSTLCYCLNGVVPRLFGGEMKGKVVVAGLDTYEHEIPVLAQHVGLVLQNARSQLFNVTVLSEVAFGCENLGMPPEEIRQRVTEALALTELHGLEDRQPSTLSGGQQQRVAIACVLAMRPDLLVLDEPTSELDPLGSEQVMKIVARLNRELGKTILLVTHDTDFVARFADRVLVLYQGHLVEDNTPRNVFTNQTLLQQYRIRPPQVCEITFELLSRGTPVTQMPITIDEAVEVFKRLEKDGQ